MTAHLIPSPPTVPGGKHSILQPDLSDRGATVPIAGRVAGGRYPIVLAVIAAVAGLAATATAAVGLVLLTH